MLTDRAEAAALAELRKLGAAEPVTNPLETLAELAGEAVAWQRIIFPNGTTLDIGAMPGADGQGMAGLRDLADSHWLRTFGSALLMSAIVAGTTLSQPQYSGYGTSQNAGSVLSEALGQNLGTAMSQLLEKNLNVAPTLKIRAGFRFNVMAVKDLVFTKPYPLPDY